MITVLVDGIIYGAQRHGGIRRYFTEVLASIAADVPEVRIILHLPGTCMGKPQISSSFHCSQELCPHISEGHIPDADITMSPPMALTTDGSKTALLMKV